MSAPAHPFSIVQTTLPPPAAPPAQEPGGWWLCAEAAQGRLLGAVQVLPQLGLQRPRCSFHLGRCVHSAPELGVHQVHVTLQIGHDATGEAEIGALHLASDVPPPLQARVADALLEGALTTLRASESPARWVVVELPGWRDAEGHSPFWQGLVRHFLPPQGLDPEQAEQRLGTAWRSHLGTMLPRQMIHAGFLPLAAQQALGRCADSALPWLHALQRAGFADWRHCRVDDGGPVLARPLALTPAQL